LRSTIEILEKATGEGVVMATLSYCGIDGGGTNIRIAQVDPSSGDLVGKVQKITWDGIRTSKDLTNKIRPYLPKRARIGSCWAGNIDKAALVNRECPNSPIKGMITVMRDLRDLGYEVTMCNDMEAAWAAESLYGHGKGGRRVGISTLSSGNNCNPGGMAPEFGHMKGNNDHYCGCGKLNHLEFDVSGRGAAMRAMQYFIATRDTKHPILVAVAKEMHANGSLKIAKGVKEGDPSIVAQCIYGITSKHVYQAYRKFPAMEPQVSIREAQVSGIADMLGRIDSAYNPLDYIVLMGSQTNDWDILIAPAIERWKKGGYQLSSIGFPPVVKTQLPEIGVQGAVADYFRQRGK
jgi:hypothetical protein